MNALFSEYSQSIDTTINEKTEDPERSLLATLAKVLYTVQLSHNFLISAFMVYVSTKFDFFFTLTSGSLLFTRHTGTIWRI